MLPYKGANPITARATDANGNAGISATVIYRTSAADWAFTPIRPAFATASIASGTQLGTVTGGGDPNSSTFTYAFATNAAGAGQTQTLNGLTINATTGIITTATAISGSFATYVVASDTAGNSAVKKFGIFIGTAQNEMFVMDGGSDVASGNGGIDTASYAAMVGGVYADLSAGFAYKQTAAGVGWTDVAAATGAPGNGYNIDTITGISNIIGTAFNDRLYGATGNNIFAPGAGADIVYGQGGTDTVDYSGLSGGVYVDLAGHYANKATSAGVGWTNPAAAQASGYTADFLSGIANVAGTAFSDRLYGTSGNNIFTPGAGADIIYGQGGVDAVNYSGLAAGVYVDLAGHYAYKSNSAATGWSNPSAAIASGYTRMR